MPRICYQDKTFGPLHLELIEQADAILTEYAEAGFDLTLRQLYYQFVARDLLPEKWADKATGSTNNQRSYKNLGTVVSNARLAGLLDWDSIRDRTRSAVHRIRRRNPAHALQVAARNYGIDLWTGQAERVEVWIEKDALAGVIEGVCLRNGVSYFACKGYVSQSAMWKAAQRFIDYGRAGHQVTVLHLGDHDPSGIDMSRDIQDRLDLFTGEGLVTVERIALNMDQIRLYRPPPNPAKVTDSRAGAYIQEHGRSSWELDALDPTTMEELIQEHIDAHRDAETFEARVEQETEEEQLLEAAARHWPQVRTFLEGLE